MTFWIFQTNLSTFKVLPQRFAFRKRCSPFYREVEAIFPSGLTDLGTVLLTSQLLFVPEVTVFQSLWGERGLLDRAHYHDDEIKCSFRATERKHTQPGQKVR